jgi:hypothetical protein
VERDATSKLPFVFGQQEAAGRRRVVSGKPGEFVVEVLKAKAKAE